MLPSFPESSIRLKIYLSKTFTFVQCFSLPGQHCTDEAGKPQPNVRFVAHGLMLRGILPKRKFEQEFVTL